MAALKEAPTADACAGVSKQTPETKNPARSIERYLLILFAIITGLMATARLLGLFDYFWLREKLETITLFLVSGLLGYTASTLTSRITRIEAGIANLSQGVRSETLDRFLELRSGLDANLDRVFGEHITELLEQVQRALKERKLKFHDLDLFRYFYKKTLERYSRAKFLVASLPYYPYYETLRDLEGSIGEFLEGEGQMSRIFFLKKEDDINQPEVLEILREHSRLGAVVYTSELMKAPRKLREFFVVDSRGRIAWEVTADPNHEITKVVATADPIETQRYLDHYNQLLELDSTRKFVTKDHAIEERD